MLVCLLDVQSLLGRWSSCSLVFFVLSFPVMCLIIIFWMIVYVQVRQMLIAILCESELKLADETIEIILDKVSINSATFSLSLNDVYCIFHS